MNRTRVLVVEDEKDVFELLRLTMGPLGYEMHYAASTEDIPAVVRDKGVRILLTDFLMPQKDGLQVAAEVRAQVDLAALPILLLTSKDLQHEETKRLSALRMDYLRKPFIPQVLSAKIKEILGRAEA